MSMSSFTQVNKKENMFCKQHRRRDWDSKFRSKDEAEEQHWCRVVMINPSGGNILGFYPHKNSEKKRKQIESGNEYLNIATVNLSLDEGVCKNTEDTSVETKHHSKTLELGKIEF